MNEIRLTANWVAAAMQPVHAALLSGDPALEFGGVSIDTRTISPADLFVAIRGERYDGADFAAAALERGAGGVVLPRGRGRAVGVLPPDAARGTGGSGGTGRSSVVYEVDDTTAALQAIAHALRLASGTTVVAITGSAGKTTTKEIASELLASRYRVIRNRGNLNNHIGLPLSLIALRQRPEMAVVELGMNHAGEIGTLVRVAEPDARVWTNVGEAHLGFFASVDAIADAKAEIFEGAGASTLLVANADDPRIMVRVPAFAGRLVSFGIDRDADVRATAVVDRGIEGVTARVTTGRGAMEIESPLVGRGNLANVLAATALALEFEIPPATIAERVSHLAPASHRGEVIRLGGGVIVVDDSYNANPTATRGALEVLDHTAARRRIAVLGEMLELGDRSIALHEEVGRAVAIRRVDALFTVGGAPAKAMAEAAVAAGMPAGRVRHFATSDEAAESAARAVESGDLVLIKGSRGVGTDRVVDRLKVERG